MASRKVTEWQRPGRVNHTQSQLEESTKVKTLWFRSPAGGLVGVFLQVGAAAVGVVEPALREHDACAWRALAAPRGAELGGGKRLVGVQVGEQPVEGCEAVDEAERAA